MLNVLASLSYVVFLNTYSLLELSPSKLISSQFLVIDAQSCITCSDDLVFSVLERVDHNSRFDLLTYILVFKSKFLNKIHL